MRVSSGAAKAAPRPPPFLRMADHPRAFAAFLQGVRIAPDMGVPSTAGAWTRVEQSCCVDTGAWSRFLTRFSAPSTLPAARFVIPYICSCTRSGMLFAAKAADSVPRAAAPSLAPGSEREAQRPAEPAGPSAALLLTSNASRARLDARGCR